MTISQLIKEVEKLSSAAHWVIPDEDTTVRELFRKLTAELEQIKENN
tara:strand:+ start:520 stop:660 length:141 start_codon:yes stop_codon:yes gene_type:complete